MRGSTPCPCDGNRRYGGNTSCVAVESPGCDPLVLDLGTGLRFWAQTLPGGPFRGSALVSHVHWDHVQGLPFFAPVLEPGTCLDVYGPPTEEGSLGESFAAFVRPPFFPVRTTDLEGEIRFHDLWCEDVEIGAAAVRARPVPHVGPTNGYRITIAGRSLAYVPDHQMPADGSMAVSDGVAALCDSVDVLIHDAQYTDEEFRARPDWGHCTVDFAVHVAREAGARHLVLFHHDPSHDDRTVDRLLEHARCRARGSAVREVLAAHEGLVVSLR